MKNDLKHIYPTFRTSHFFGRIVLKIGSKCSCIAYTLRFFADFCLILHQKLAWCGKPVYLLAFFLFTCHLALANSRLQYAFESSDQAKRFEHLTSILRCVVCQNQNLAESNADIALDLKEKIYHAIQIGQTDEMILQSLQSRYGDFILFSPPFNQTTILLWFGPFLLLFIGFYVIRNLLK